MLLKKIGTVLLFSLLLLGCQDKDNDVTTNESVTDQQSQNSSANSNTNTKVTPDIADPSIELMLADVSEREVGSSNAIELLFNIPLEPNQNFDRFIETSPKLETPVLSEDGKRLQFFGLIPEVTYKINVIAGLEANNGNSFPSEKEYSVKTRPITPVVTFKIEKGAILVPGYSDELGIYSVNVSEADLNIYRVKPKQLTQFMREFKQIANSSAYYYQNSRRDKMVEHIYTARIETGGKPNQRQITKFPIADKKWVNESGVYFATLGKPGSFEYTAATWFSVSTIGLQVREFSKKMYVITQDIKTGKLQKGVQVDFLDANSKRYASLTSDKEGRVKVNKNNRLSLIVARNGEQVTVLPYKNPRFDLSNFNIGDRPHSENQLFAYSERDIYRPAELLTLSILSRDADGRVQNRPLSVGIFKPNGSLYKSVWLKASDAKNGYYEYSMSLPKSGPLGNWQAKVSVQGNNRYSARFHFKVEEFLPERLRLTLGENGKVNSFTPQQGLKLKVLGEYLYGAPAAGNKLSTNVAISAWTTPFKQWPNYFVGSSDGAKNSHFKLADVKLNDKGQYVSKIKKNWKQWRVPVKVRLNYSLFESGGRALNRHHDSLLWPVKSFIAVKPSFKHGQSASNDKIHFNLLKLNKNGESLAKGEVKVELVREEKNYFWTYDHDSGWHYEHIEKEYTVDNRTLKFTNKAPLKLSEMVEWGDYRLELTDLSTKGKTVYRFRAGEDWYNNWRNNKGTIRPDRVNLALDKASYLPNDKLNLSIGSPTAGNALITIETDKILYQHEVKVVKGETSFTLTVPDGLKRHDAYISAFVISPSNSDGQSVAKRSFGIIHLPLNRDPKKIALTISTPERWTPNQTVVAKVIAKDAQGKALSGHAKVTLSAVDAGVLSVSGYEVEDPFNFFYGQRAYQGSITDIYDHVMTPLFADLAKVRWGGDAALTRGGEKAETEVQIVSLFSGEVSIINGVAEIPLQLPAFDGELKLTAVAFDSDKFAKAEQSVKVASPVVLQVSMPKFMASGDSSDVILDLTNITDKAIKGTLALTVSGKLIAQKKLSDIALEANQKQTIKVTLNAQQDIGAGKIKAVLKLTADDAAASKEEIIRKWTLAVRATQASEFHSERALLMPGDSLALPEKALLPFNDASKQLQLSVAVTPNLDAKAHWKYLTEYPYSCLEQTTSKSRPFAAVLNNKGNATNLENVDVTLVDQKAQDAIERYGELQRSDGSFGLWSKHSSEEHWLTAYATEFLFELKAKGVGVPEEMLNKATKRLQSYVNSRSRHHVKTWSDNPRHYAAAYRAYAAYVLAKQNKVTLGPLRDIEEKDLKFAQGKLPGVHLGLAMLMSGSEKEGAYLIKEALAKHRGNDYLGDYGSELRDQAMAINALLTTPSVNNELKQLALSMLPDLAADMYQQRWLSTQERSAILLLAMTMKDQSKLDWKGTLTLNGDNESLQKSGEYHQTIKALNALQATFSNAGEQPIYASFDWSGIKKQADYNVDHGIEVTAEHFLVKGNKTTKLSDNSTLHSGELLLTRITLTSTERVPDALVVNLMPAGVELENQNLNHSLKLTDIYLNGKKVRIDAEIEHEEYRDDRYVAAIDLPKGHTQTLYVLSRAVNPGTYVFPAVRVESMYKPAVYGVGGSIKQINVSNQP